MSEHPAKYYDAAQPDPRKPERGAGQPPKDGQAATGHIHLRCTMRRKSAYVRAAKPGKLTDWVFAQLDRASGYAAANPQNE